MFVDQVFGDFQVCSDFVFVQVQVVVEYEVFVYLGWQGQDGLGDFVQLCLVQYLCFIIMIGFGYVDGVFGYGMVFVGIGLVVIECVMVGYLVQIVVWFQDGWVVGYVVGFQVQVLQGVFGIGWVEIVCDEVG